MGTIVITITSSLIILGGFGVLTWRKGFAAGVEAAKKTGSYERGRADENARLAAQHEHELETSRRSWAGRVEAAHEEAYREGWDAAIEYVRTQPPRLRERGRAHAA